MSGSCRLFISCGFLDKANQWLSISQNLDSEAHLINGELKPMTAVDGETFGRLT